MFANDLRPKATWSSPKPTYFSNGEEHPPVYTPDESHLEYSRRNCLLLLLRYRTQAASLFPLRPTVRRRLSLRRNAGIGEPPQSHAAVGSSAVRSGCSTECRPGRLCLDGDCVRRRSGYGMSITITTRPCL
jgi:hypothetical protein